MTGRDEVAQDLGRSEARAELLLQVLGDREAHVEADEVAETRQHVNALNERLIAGVDDLGGTVVTPREASRRGALVCIRSTDAPALVAALTADGVVTSERDSNLRVSAHAYNTVEDIDTVLAALAKQRSLLG